MSKCDNAVFQFDSKTNRFYKQKHITIHWVEKPSNKKSK